MTDTAPKAIVDGAGNVLNVVVGPDVHLSPGCTLVDVGPGAAPGGTYAAGVFTPPSAAQPEVCGDAIIGAISKGDRAKCDPTDLARIAWRDDVPTSNAKLARIAKALGTTPDALRSAAQSVS